MKFESISRLAMKFVIVLLATNILAIRVPAQRNGATNPIIFADVPDMSIIRVDDMYYMSSTTMHMAPGVPIMKSKDLVNWKLIGYAYDTLASNDALNLNNGTSAYGRGSWASCLRFHQGVYYITTFSQTTGKTHIFSCQDINKGEWKETSFSPDYHDHSLFFDDDGRVYMIYGSGIIKLIELSADLSGKNQERQNTLSLKTPVPRQDLTLCSHQRGHNYSRSTVDFICLTSFGPTVVCVQWWYTGQIK